MASKRLFFALRSTYQFIKKWNQYCIKYCSNVWVTDVDCQKIRMDQSILSSLKNDLFIFCKALICLFIFDLGYRCNNKDYCWFPMSENMKPRREFFGLRSLFQKYNLGCNCTTLSPQGLKNHLYHKFSQNESPCFFIWLCLNLLR